jgi:hypothetical protein
LGIPESVQKVVIEGDVPAVTQNDGTVLSGYGLPPPLVVDSPVFLNRLDLPSRLSSHAHMDGLTPFVRADVDEAGLTKRS